MSFWRNNTSLYGPLHHAQRLPPPLADMQRAKVIFYYHPVMDPSFPGNEGVGCFATMCNVDSNKTPFVTMAQLRVMELLPSVRVTSLLAPRPIHQLLNPIVILPPPHALAMYQGLYDPLTHRFVVPRHSWEPWIRAFPSTNMNLRNLGDWTLGNGEYWGDALHQWRGNVPPGVALAPFFNTHFFLLPMLTPRRPGTLGIRL